jgi:hypothetical protein
VLSEGRTDALDYFAFGLLFEGDADLRELPLTERKGTVCRNCLMTLARPHARFSSRAGRPMVSCAGGI